MAKELIVNVTCQLSGTYRKTTALQNALSTIADTFANQYNNGIGDNKSDRIVYINSTPAASADTHDLDTGTLTDIYGDTITFSNIRALIVHNRSTTAGRLLDVGGDFIESMMNGLTAETPTLQVDPDAILCFSNPITAWAVSVSADVITVDPGAQSDITYDLILIGED